MRNLCKSMIIAGLLLCAASVYAADVKMSIQPQLIGLLDRAVLKIEFIDTRGDAVDIPEVDGLKIQYRGQSSETQIVNFKTTSKVVHSYLVTPTKTGDFTIGPVLCKYKGGQKKVSAKLRVIKKADDPESQKLSEILFSRITADGGSPYVYEPFDLTLKIYVRDGIQIDGRFSIRGGLPESGLDGDLEWEVVDSRREQYKGQIFTVHTLRTTAKSLTAGSFNFKPEVQINLVVPRQQRRSFGFDDPFFGDFFGRQERRPMVLDCNSLDIDILPIPAAGRPADYTGGVGALDFNVEIGPKQVKAGEPVTVKMRISGKGNLEKIMPPQLAADPNVKLYDARSVPTENPNEVLFEQVVIPKSEAVKEIPEIRFSYFNTKTADFRTITQGPFPLSVEAAPQQAAQVMAHAPTTVQQETRILGRDIVYLKPQPKRWHYRSNGEQNRTLAYTLLALPAFVLGLVFIITRRRNALSDNVALARRQKAPRAARQKIQEAESALRNGDEAAFHEAAWNALTSYIGHRLNLAPGEVTLATAQARFPQAAEELAALFNTFEQRRYATAAGNDDSAETMKSLLSRLNATLKTCERAKS